MVPAKLVFGDRTVQSGLAYETPNHPLGGDWEPVLQVMATGPGDEADCSPRLVGTSKAQGSMTTLIGECGGEASTPSLPTDSSPLACDCSTQIGLLPENQLQIPVAGSLDC